MENSPTIPNGPNIHWERNQQCEVLRDQVCTLTWTMFRVRNNHKRSLLRTSRHPRLEASNLILRGTPDEASSVVLKGTLVLCLAEPLRIQGIRLRFTGEKRLRSVKAYDITERTAH
jgi:hypothetical protein